MELSARLKAYAKTLAGKEQLVVTAFARALEVIPRQLADNAGFDSMDLMNLLRKEHGTQNTEDSRNMGIDIDNEGVSNCFEKGIWEPASNKRNCISSASEAACLVVSIDETVRSPSSDKPGAPDSSGVGLGRGGTPISAAMGGQGMQGLVGRGRGVRAFKGRGGG